MTQNNDMADVRSAPHVETHMASQKSDKIFFCNKIDLAGVSLEIVVVNLAAKIQLRAPYVLWPVAIVCSTKISRIHSNISISHIPRLPVPRVLLIQAGYLTDRTRVTNRELVVGQASQQHCLPYCSFLAAVTVIVPYIILYRRFIQTSRLR